MPDEKLDKKEAAKKIGELMKAHSTCGDWAALGRRIADDLHERAYSPIPTVTEWLILNSAIDRRDRAGISLVDRRHAERRDGFIQCFGIERYFERMESFDTPEDRVELDKRGLPHSLSNLTILRRETQTEVSEND